MDAELPNKPKTIMHVVRSPVGGIFRHIVDLAIAQRGLGNDVALICDSSTGGDLEERSLEELATKLGSHRVRRIRMDRAITFRDVVTLLRVLAFAQEVKLDVIHCHGAKGGVYGRIAGALLSRSSCPPRIIYTPHGGSLHYSSQSASGKVYFAVERFLQRYTHCLIHVSEQDRSDYRVKVGTPGCDSRVVYSGLHPEEFHIEGGKFADADFAYVGVLRDLKGVDVYIQAAALALGQYPGLNFWLGGSGSEADVSRYKGMVRALGVTEQVEFREPTPIKEVLPRIANLVLPSRAEAFGYVLLEAAAAGVPVIATNVGGIPEVLEGEEECLVDPGDPVALSEALLTAVKDRSLSRDLAQKRRVRVARRFSIKQMVEDTHRAYSEQMSQA